VKTCAVRDNKHRGALAGGALHDDDTPSYLWHQRNLIVRAALIYTTSCAPTAALTTTSVARAFLPQFRRACIMGGNRRRRNSSRVYHATGVARASGDPTRLPVRDAVPRTRRTIALSLSIRLVGACLAHAGDILRRVHLDSEQWRRPQSPSLGKKTALMALQLSGGEHSVLPGAEGQRAAAALMVAGAGGDDAWRVSSTGAGLILGGRGGGDSLLAHRAPLHKTSLPFPAAGYRLRTRA